jgi:hypothetical protein
MRLLRFIIVVIRSTATLKIEIMTITIVMIGWKKLSSKNQSATEKSWKKLRGSMTCSLKILVN